MLQFLSADERARRTLKHLTRRRRALSLTFETVKNESVDFAVRLRSHPKTGAGSNLSMLYTIRRLERAAFRAAGRESGVECLAGLAYRYE